jgi:hypothetical protein
MAAICYRRQAGAVVLSTPLRDDWEAVRPWWPYTRVWVVYRCAYMRSTIVNTDPQLVQ